MTQMPAQKTSFIYTSSQHRLYHHMTSSKLDSPIFSPSEASDGCLVTTPSCASFLCYRSGKMHCPSPDVPLTAHLTNWPISHPLDNQPAQKSCLHFILILLPDAVSAQLTWPVNLVSVTLRFPTPSGITAPQFLFSGCFLPVSTVFQKNTFLALLIFRWMLSPDSSPITPSQTYLSSGRFHPGKICFC